MEGGRIMLYYCYTWSCNVLHVRFACSQNYPWFSLESKCGINPISTGLFSRSSSGVFPSPFIKFDTDISEH